MFASLTQHNKLVLPKVPHGFAVTGFLLGCLGKRACPLKNKNALSALLKGHCAQDWITFSDPCVLRGGYNKKVPPCFARHDFLFVCLAKQALHASKQKIPHIVRDFFVCAQDWIRTSTPFPAPPPQGGLSTNFNTRAPK